MANAYLVIDQVSKRFGNLTVVHEASISVERGEFVSLLGPSGCGKTTILRMVAGFETVNKGRILIADKDVTTLKANQRKIGMVFQSYALFPNMTVAGNIAFGLKVARKSGAEIGRRVTEMLALVKLPQVADRYPWQLSGGQQQRIALARALAPSPALLLLDEPLSALDAKIRVSLREEIRAIQRKLGITTIFVTHDQEEALSLSDRVVVMNEGRIEQIGTPFEVYNRPTTRFVASFVGTLSLLQGKISDQKKGVVTAAGFKIEGVQLPNGAARNAPVTIALRPEALRLDARKGDARITGKVLDVDFLGSVIRMRIDAGGTDLAFDTFNDPTTPPPKAGDRIHLHFAKSSALLLPD